MAFKLIEKTIGGLSSSPTELDIIINNSAFHLGLTIKSFVFYDSGDNVVTPTAVTIDIKCYTDREDMNQWRTLPFFTTNLEEGNIEFVSTGTVTNLIDPLGGVGTIGQPVELVKVLFSSVTGAVKVKVKVIALKARS